MTEIDIYGESQDHWDILPDESTRAFAAFGIFRDQGPTRTIKSAAQALEVSTASLKEWVGRHAWLDRARAYDLENDRARRTALESESLQMRQRHANLSVFMQKKVAEGMAQVDPSSMTAKDLAYWLDLSSKLERISRGVNEAQRVELTGANGGPIELAEALTTEDRAALMAQVQAELAKRLGSGTPTDALEDIWEGEIEAPECIVDG